MSFWIALDDVTRESGALEFVAGSHQGKRYKPFGGIVLNPTVAALLQRPEGDDYQPDFDSHRGEFSIISEEMRAGDVVAFHSLTFHAAGGNITNDRTRRAYSIRYCGDNALYNKDDFSLPFLTEIDRKNGAELNSKKHPPVWPKLSTN